MQFGCKICGMRKVFIGCLCLFAVGLFLSPSALAEEANNKAGIHILHPEEIGKAAELVNSNGGDWGYVTIPIQADDRDRKRWQKFMDEAKRLHLVPIMRLATYGEGEIWVQPSVYEVLDFANFLSDLDWPTKKRYVVIFNEVNRSNEWGGIIDPEGYAAILAYAQEVFSQRSSDFVVLPAGMDAAAPNVNGEYMDEYVFLNRVARVKPEVFKQLAGWTAHAYPNPDFSGQPWETHRMSVVSYKKELAFLRRLGVPGNLPVFITETGWRQGLISQEQAARFYTQAFEGPWQDKQVMAVTPFILFAGEGPFANFSFLDKNMKETPIAAAWEGLKKEAGKPELGESGAVVAWHSTEGGNAAEPVAPESGFWKSLENLVGRWSR